jgi:hypothetical protein
MTDRERWRWLQEVFHGAVSLDPAQQAAYLDAAQAPELLSRFRSERQILAGLDHPKVARLLDGGTTEMQLAGR